MEVLFNEKNCNLCLIVGLSQIASVDINIKNKT